MSQVLVENLRKKAQMIINIALNGNKNLIFGTGWMGSKFYEALRQLNIQVDGFVVSSLKGQAKKHYNTPVYSIEMVNNFAKNYNIFIALRNQESSITDIFKARFGNVQPICYPDDLCVISAKYYLDYLESMKVDLNSRIITINNIKFVNPFHKTYDYLLSWVYEAGDLILPELFEDFNSIDEGPYENGKVVLKKGSGEIVFDCGANIGLFTTIAAHKGCKVYAFEPVPEAIQYLREVIELYPDSITLCPYALCNKNGVDYFNIQNHDLLGASLLEGHNSIDSRLEVECKTIDAFVKQFNISHIDYIKADIEGSERDMLLGAAASIKKFLPKISICTYHLEDDKEVLEKIILGIDSRYVIQHLWKKMYAYVPEDKK